MIQFLEEEISSIDSQSSLKFLIIDDEAFNLFALDAMLRNLKIENIEQSFNGKHALEMLAER